MLKVLTGVTIAKVARHGLLLESGDHVAADAVVWTAGFAVPALAPQVGLAVDDHGRMLVDPTMRLSHLDVYGDGDAAAARNQHGDECAWAAGLEASPE